MQDFRKEHQGAKKKPLTKLERVHKPGSGGSGGGAPGGEGVGLVRSVSRSAAWRDVFRRSRHRFRPLLVGSLHAHVPTAWKLRMLWCSGPHSPCCQALLPRSAPPVQTAQHGRLCPNTWARCCSRCMGSGWLLGSSASEHYLFSSGLFAG